MRPLPISKTRSNELMSLIEVGPAVLQDVRAKLSSTDQKFLKLEHLSSFFAKLVSRDNAVAISKIAVSLRRIADRSENSLDEIMKALVNGLKQAGWSDVDINRWAEVSEPLKRIISEPSIELAIKASDLYYKHIFHMHDLTVTTDIRPVLNEERTAIEAAIVKNHMTIEYSDGEEHEDILEIVLSTADMKRIRDEMDRAIKKSELVKGAVEEKLRVSAIVYGSDW